MMDKNSPEIASGQIVHTLKMSQLNYMLQETPYSTYITIRKKFHKEVNQTREDREASVVKENRDITNEKLVEKLNSMEKENRELKEKVKDNFIDMGKLEYDVEELEFKNEHLESEKSDLDDKVEELYKELSDMKKENTEVKTRETMLEKKAKETKTKLKDALENVEMMECTVENKILEIEQLKCQIGNNQSIADTKIQCEEDLPSTSKCGECKYESDEESEMKIHMESNHDYKCNTCEISCISKLLLENHMKEIHKEKVDESEIESVSLAKPSQSFECNVCNLACKTEEKLKNHMCRVTVRNPSFCDLYTKNWIVLNRCTFIYHRLKKEEVALLHCKDCVDNNNRCVEKFPLWLPAQEDETDGLWHLDLSKFLKDGRIEWQSVKTLVRT